MKKKYKLICFEWSDTTSPVDNGWKTPEECIKWAEEDDYWVKQTGFIIKETKKYLLIASRFNTTFSAGREIETVGDITKIPTTWIRNRKNFN